MVCDLFIHCCNNNCYIGKNKLIENYQEGSKDYLYSYSFVKKTKKHVKRKVFKSRKKHKKTKKIICLKMLPCGVEPQTFSS